ncbi:MAG: DoxX family protein [Brumimicrobium sp.]
MKQRTKRLFNPGQYSKNVSIALLILRVVVGVFMLTHGIGKFEALFDGQPIKFADPIGIGATASLALTVFAEVFCSILLILGLATRFAAIPLLITMLVAAFVVHADDGFGKQEFALLYGVIYATVAMIGAGKYSLDYLVFRRGGRIV